ncbi:choice-of-anchor J domain-containing protein [uncultured Tenacibaculum sp.]|uniref:T9SS-dependent choice-of-anchor J family protein n=1 Tax=uncultured Tenacibaculum sp. TaxID=174713 RepID=UPI00261960F1|nr:choice-of-anchor J domain-containing protein [uncultured Tenacibaculum sp.]
MKKNYFLITLLLSVFLTVSSFGQTTTIDFETENSGYTTSGTEGASFIDVFNRISSTVGTNTSFIWAIEDTNITNPSITLDAINVSSATGFTFSVDMIAHHFNDWDNSDELLITYSVDGGPSQNLMWVQNTGETFNDPAAIDTDFDGNGECSNVLPAITTGTGTDGCNVSSNDFQTFTTNTIPLSGATNLVITLQFNGFTSTDEGMYLDNITVTQVSGNVAPAITNISNTPTNPSSSDAVTVSADLTDADGISTATLRWGTTSGSLTNNISMSNTSGNTYSGTIPAQADGTTVYYTIEAVDSNASPETTTSSENNYGVIDPIAATIPYNIDFTTNNPFMNNWTEQNIVGPTISWAFSSGLGAQMNAFSESCNAQDWLISPAFNLDSTTQEYLSIDLNQRFGSQNLELLYSTDYSGTGDPNTASWTSLQSIAPQSSNSTVASIAIDNISLNAISGTAVYFAFRYTSATTGCSDWRVANLSIQTGFVWTGATSNDWGTNTNWLTNTTPSTSADVLIPNGLTNYPTASSFIFVNSITFESGTSLLFNSFVNGQITYNRDVTSNWHLVASPINGESINNLITNNSFSTGTSTNIGIGLYDNDNATTPWQYQNSSSTGALASGTGISVKLNTSSIVFKGNMYTGSDVIPVTTGSRTDFNLIGNRYTAYLDSDAFLTNTSNTPALAEQTIWLWDGTQYVTKNLTESIKIAPTQGFFIKAAIDTNVALNPAMLSHNSTDTFLRQAPKSSFELSINNGEVAGSTKVYYIDGKTKGFDNGYDSKIFEGVQQDFAVFTQLLSNNDGRKLAIQTLPNNNLETMVIPVGLITDADEEITFSAITTNLPSGVNVYLEDRVNNTFVNLSEGNHTIQTKSANNGIGQYYIHTTSAKLSNDDISKDIKNVSIYSSANNEITVTGLQAEANVKVFSLLGEELINTDINSNGVSKISLPNLSTGVYVVKLNSTLGSITKKVILE